MTTVITAGVQYIDDAGLEPFAEAYVTPGKPPWECTNVLVAWGSKYGQGNNTFPKVGSSDRVVNRAVKSAIINVGVCECVTVQDDMGHFPSLEAYADDAKRIYDRGEALYSGYLCDITSRTLWAGTVPGQETGATSLTELIWDPPSGGAMVGHFQIITMLQA